jgi:dipeptide/tripeptide permease
MNTYATVFAGLTIMATGAGLFKPIISGTLARSTTEENSGFGFGIYYWMINLGAFLAPLAVNQLKGISWHLVFVASAIYVAAMLLPAIFVYRDPPKPQNTKTIREVLGGAALVLRDARFMLMIFIYSGFWILYFQNFGSVLWFLRDFIDAAPVNALFARAGLNITFDAEFVTLINAGTIILLQVLVSRAVKNLAPLPTMILGMAIGAVGFICLAFASTVWIFIAGIVIFSLGEMTAHPKYYSYVGLVAPQDKKAVYMGYAFLYGVIGSLIGSNLGGTMYESMLKPLVGQPGAETNYQIFWLAFAGIGLAAMVGLILYNRILSKDTAESNRLAAQIMRAVYSALVLIGGWFLYDAFSSTGPIPYKTVIQALIMILIGGGGLFATRSRLSPPTDNVSR